VAVTTTDLTAALAEHESRSIGDLRAEGLTVAERLYSSPRVHRLIPDRAAMAIAWLVGTTQWLLSKRQRAEAHRYMSLLVEGTPRSHEARALARAHLVESSAAGIVFWRTPMLRSARVDGLSHLEHVERRGAGAILLSAHLGANHLGKAQPLLSGGRRIQILGGDEWLFADRFAGYDGHRAIRLRRMAEELGGRWIRPNGAYELCQALLRQGELCLFPFDVPGSTEATFLDKRAWVRSGVARLALETGAPIVPVFAGREGHRLFVRLEAPIEPEDHPDLDGLVQHLAQVVGGEILRRPDERERTPFLSSVWSEPGSR
jgi:lauroyl/myristoyl acyltransferase